MDIWFSVSLGLLLVIVIGTFSARRRILSLRETIQGMESELAVQQGKPAVVAHEIRTPLALVKGASEMLREPSAGPLTDIQKNFVSTITENTCQVIDIAENFLTDMKLETADRSNFSNVDIVDIVAGTARELRRIVDIPIEVHARSGLIDIWADEGLIRQLVWNLVNNAARHGQGHKISVTVDQSDNGGVRISVGDNGVGMTETDRELLFEAFATGSTRRPGSGIGMMVAKKVAEHHGGTILVDSKTDHGTVFHVVLPQGESS